MKKISCLVLLIVATSFLASAQEVKSAKYAFAMKEPKGWLSTSKQGLRANLGKFEFSESELEALLKENNRTILVAAYTKYDPKTKAGIIPTIQINVRPNQTKDFGTFKTAMIKSIEGMRQQLQQLEFIEPPIEMEISGVRSVFLHLKYILTHQDGRTFNIRSRMYAIPRSNTFFQVNFTDNPDDEDCSAEFDDLLKTITIGTS